MSQTARYHHGDLHATLLREAAVLLREQGIEGLSLRRLAERAGVSRTAPYHHFADKNALLCALAEQGFRKLETLMQEEDLESEPARGLRRFVHAYLRFLVRARGPFLCVHVWGSSMCTLGASVLFFVSLLAFSDVLISFLGVCKWGLCNLSHV